MAAPKREDELLRTVEDVWARASVEFERITGLKPSQHPSGVRVVDDRTPGLNLGGMLLDGQIHLTRDIVRDPALLSGVIAMECARSAMPVDHLCRQSIDDVVTEFARQYLSGADQEKWSEFWSEHIPEQRVDGILLYRPAKSFEALYALVSGEGLKEIVKDLVNASRYGVDLDFEDYVRYFEARYRTFSVPLTSSEVKILDALHRDPAASNETMARRTGLTAQWVSQRIAALRDRHILRTWEAIHFSKIGIRMYSLLVGMDDSGEEPQRFFTECPFVYGARRVLTGPWHTLMTLSVPDNIECIHALDRFLKAIAKWGVRTSLTEIVSSGASFCFEYYDTDRSDWRIPWDLQRVQLAKIHRDNLASAFPRLDSAKPRTRLELTDLDMRVIDAVRHGDSSVSAVRDKLKVGQVRVAASLKKLREDGVISLICESHNVGLLEHVFVSTDDCSVGKSLAAWAQRLPRCIVSFDINERLMLLVGLPSGGSYGLTSALEMIPGRTASGLLAAPMYSRWEVPLSLWNAYSQQWRCPREEVAQWLDSVR